MANSRWEEAVYTTPHNTALAFRHSAAQSHPVNSSPATWRPIYAHCKLQASERTRGACPYPSASPHARPHFQARQLSTPSGNITSSTPIQSNIVKHTLPPTYLTIYLLLSHPPYPSIFHSRWGQALSTTLPCTKHAVQDTPTSNSISPDIEFSSVHSRQGGRASPAQPSPAQSSRVYVTLKPKPKLEAMLKLNTAPHRTAYCVQGSMIRHNMTRLDKTT